MKEEDCTREVALHMQSGIVEAKRWVYGPITFARVEYPRGIGASIQITLGDYCFQIATMRAFRDGFTP